MVHKSEGLKGSSNCLVSERNKVMLRINKIGPLVQDKEARNFVTVRVKAATELRAGNERFPVFRYEFESNK